MDLLRTAERILASAGIHTDLNTFLVLFGLAFARVGAATYFAPFFGGQSVPVRVRVGLAVVLAAISRRIWRGGRRPVERRCCSWHCWRRRCWRARCSG